VTAWIDPRHANEISPNMKAAVSPATMPTGFSEVEIPCGEADLAGDLTVPDGAHGIVLFVHGSGSSRKSPRNQYVAEQINEAGLGTLLFDLLTPGEAREEALTGELRFNIPFLTARLRAATRWVRGNPSLNGLKMGYFGASTGAAAALAAATYDPGIKAIISRGGRTDLAGTKVENVRAATLLIVGGLDHPVIRWNRETFDRLSCEKRFSIIEGASHLFEEPGKLEEVAKLAASWFKQHLNSPDDDER
jgi:putative phosphoribosyl transferase